MSIVIAYDSALAYWRLVGSGFLGDTRARQKATRQARATLESKEKPRLEGDNRRPGGCAPQVHVLVSNGKSRVRTKSFLSNVWSTIHATYITAAGLGIVMNSTEF